MIKLRSKILIFLYLVIFPLQGCKDNLTQYERDISPFIFGKSIEGVEIGDDSITVIQKLGKPTRIEDGDFNGYIFYYVEGRLANTFVAVSNDRALSLGVIGISVEGPYQGKSKDSIGIGSDRDFVISKLGVPDTTVGETPIYDTYFYGKNIFEITYENQHALRIGMGESKRY